MIDYDTVLTTLNSDAFFSVSWQAPSVLAAQTRDSSTALSSAATTWSTKDIVYITLLIIIVILILITILILISIKNQNNNSLQHQYNKKNNELYVQDLYPERDNFAFIQSDQDREHFHRFARNSDKNNTSVTRSAYD